MDGTRYSEEGESQFAAFRRVQRRKKGKKSENKGQFLDPWSPGSVSRTPLKRLRGPCPWVMGEYSQVALLPSLLSPDDGRCSTLLSRLPPAILTLMIPLTTIGTRESYSLLFLCYAGVRDINEDERCISDEVRIG